MDMSIAAWNVSTGEAIWWRSQAGEVDYVFSLAISPDGQTLATSMFWGIIKLWSLSTGEKIYILTDDSHTEHSLAFSPDGKILASGGLDFDSTDNDSDPYGTIELWNLDTRQKICTLMGHSDRVHSVAFSPDGQTLVSSSQDNTIKIWRLSS
jgi:WD40 repeat protein